MPLINYESGTDQYREQMFSLEIVWNNARDAELFDDVGSAPAIREARIKNIYRGKYREYLTNEQIKAIKSTAKGPIDILAITGKFYIGEDHRWA